MSKCYQVSNTHFDVHSHLSWTDMTLDILPNLKRLNLSCCTRITGVAVKTPILGFIKAGQKPSQLEYLNLDLCDSVNSDATAWARSKGIEVSHATAEQMKSGKRVRYSY